MFLLNSLHFHAFPSFLGWLSKTCWKVACNLWWLLGPKDLVHLPGRNKTQESPAQIGCSLELLGPKNLWREKPCLEYQYYPFNMPKWRWTALYRLFKYTMRMYVRIYTYIYACIKMLIFKEEILNKDWINKAWPYIRPLGMVQKIQNSGYSLAKTVAMGNPPPTRHLSGWFS